MWNEHFLYAVEYPGPAEHPGGSHREECRVRGSETKGESVASSRVSDPYSFDTEYGYGTSSTSKHEISKFFLLLWVIFALQDPDPDSEYGSGSTDLIESGSNQDPKPWHLHSSNSSPLTGSWLTFILSGRCLTIFILACSSFCSQMDGWKLHGLC